MSTPQSQRSLQARAAALRSWAFTDDRSRRTRAARSAFLEKFEEQVDPDRRLTAAERSKRAQALRKAHFAELARKSALARRKGRLQ